MTKYLRKELHSDNYDKEGRKNIAKEVVTAKLLKKDTTIETAYGPALITAGNYVLTNELGEKVGMTQQDFERQYAQWDK